ncbi:MAG TPA: sigma-54 dependent transcriptional regulator [Candidatus Aquilonibacter sp.]|jgi:DNA-binding NtrC family response regulator|nr:sigma-54 dependent transcriptional regulator [Candidatus Aquilonibacter sp.]
MPKKRIIVGEDDQAIRGALVEFLESLDYEVVEAASCAAIREAFRESSPDAAVLDYSLPDGTALDLLPHLKQSHPSVPLILLTGNATVQLAVRAIKEGAEQFLTKPVEMSAIAVVLERALKNQRNQQKQLAGRAREKRESVNPFLGTSAAIRELAEQAERLSASHCTVLIAGETGSGKGVLAKWLHDQSQRSEEAFVDLNCAGLGRELLESELFGHEAGAFTGAVQRKLGLFEVAQRGTVFLDEIGDMDLQVQPKLLKVLEEKRFRRLGDVQERQLDVRLIAASHENLAEQVRKKKFRSDLYFRVSTVTIRVPALRERLEDIPILASQFFERVAMDLGRQHLTISDQTMETLAGYSWPGNIRELKNVIERAVLLSAGETIRPRDLHLEFKEQAAMENGPELTLSEVQRQHIQKTLEAERGNVARAASRLGVTRSTLYNKMKTFAISAGKS